MDRPNGVQQLLARRILQEVCFRAGLQCLADVFVCVVGTEHDNPGRGVLLENGVDSLNSVHLRHAEVQQQYVGAMQKKLLDSLLAIRCFANNVHILLGIDQCSQPLPDYGMIIRDHSANLFAEGWLGILLHSEPVGRPLLESGTLTVTRVPFPGWLFSTQFPPISSARSRMPLIPIPRRGGSELTNPRPSSPMWRRTSFSPKASSIRILLA